MAGDDGFGALLLQVVGRFVDEHLALPVDCGQSWHELWRACHPPPIGRPAGSSKSHSPSTRHLFRGRLTEMHCEFDYFQRVEPVDGLGQTRDLAMAVDQAVVFHTCHRPARPMIESHCPKDYQSRY